MKSSGIIAGLTALVLLIVGVIALAPAQSAIAGPHHVTVCHVTGSGFIALDINANAQPAHLAHGDLKFKPGLCDYPGGGGGGGGGHCTSDADCPFGEICCVCSNACIDPHTEPCSLC